jgi:hypothetical protein
MRFEQYMADPLDVICTAKKIHTIGINNMIIRIIANNKLKKRFIFI